MKTIKNSQLKEILTDKGLDEGFIEKFFRMIKRKKKEREFEKLTNDPKYQAILKKYNIEPVPYGQDISFKDLRKLQKKSGRIK